MLQWVVCSPVDPLSFIYSHGGGEDKVVPRPINNIKPHLLQRTGFHVFEETQYAKHFYLLLCLNRVVTGLLAFKKNGLQRDTVGRVLGEGGGVQRDRERRAFKSQVTVLEANCPPVASMFLLLYQYRSTDRQTTPTVLHLHFVNAKITLQLVLSRPWLHKELQDCLSVGRTDTHTHTGVEAWPFLVVCHNASTRRQSENSIFTFRVHGLVLTSATPSLHSNPKKREAGWT